MNILALDIATRTGFAFGAPGEQPRSGSKRFASPGASHAAIFADALTWANTIIREMQPKLIVWESPIATSNFKAGHTNVNATRILFGLPAVISAVALMLGVHDLREASTRDVRKFFIHQNAKRADAKRLTMMQCHKLGWQPTDDNEGDALAVWSYMVALIAPKLAPITLPLFGVHAA